MGHKKKDAFTQEWSSPPGQCISASLAPMPLCLSVGVVAISSLSRERSIIAHSGPHACGKVEGEKSSLVVAEEGKDGGGSCLQQALRTEVPSAAANTVLTIVRLGTGESEAQTHCSAPFGTRSQNLRCQLLKVSSPSLPLFFTVTSGAGPSWFPVLAHFCSCQSSYQ